MSENAPNAPTSEPEATDFSPPETAVEIRRDQGGRFVKGASGNVHGRPRLEVEVRRLAQERGRDAIEKLAEIMRTSKSERIAIAAASALLDRGFGTPRQSVALDVETHAGAPAEAVDWESISPDQAVAAYKRLMDGE
jgi:hypothetical protein